MRELGWNEIPRAHEIHQHLMENAPDVDWYGDGNPVYFKADDADTGCWETVLIPKDCLGPSHVTYFLDRIEVWRYWQSDGCVEHAASFSWDDPKLLTKVLVAATEDICADWHSMM